MQIYIISWVHLVPTKKLPPYKPTTAIGIFLVKVWGVIVNMKNLHSHHHIFIFSFILWYRSSGIYLDKFFPVRLCMNLLFGVGLNQARWVAEA